jgi:hypothetical protein
MSKGISGITTALHMIFKNVETTASTTIKSFAKLLSAYKSEQSIIAESPNSRVKHLALHSKKARVRKKNRQRILREYYKNLEVMK